MIRRRTRVVLIGLYNVIRRRLFVFNICVGGIRVTGN